jgi:hypothetical protein
MLFTKKIVTNSRVARDQLANRDLLRNAANMQEQSFNPMLKELGLKANAGLIPQEIYQEFDNNTVERMRSDDGDTFLNDLMPMSKSVNIGKLTYVTRRASDAGVVQTSMTGQTGVKMDQTEYDYDGTIIPVHDSGFFRNWREWNAQKSESFDALIDDQRETVASVRAHLADSFLDGHKDKDDNFIVVDGRQWQGIRNDSRVQQVDLGAGGVNFDFTLNTNTGEQNKNALIEVLDFLYITNNCSRDVTVYVSREIARNWERNFSTSFDGQRIIDQLSKLQGVAAIKVSNKLTGNQLMAFPLDKGSVIPVTGMGMATMALPRHMYNSNYEFVTATAAGWMVKTDYSGNTCALYASE